MSAVRTIEGLNEDVLEFEDVFEIITPGTIERRIHTLDDAWQELLKANKSNTYIKSEYDKWNIWAKKVLDSWTSRLFISSQRELDNWSARYKVAYSKASSGSNAPPPDAIFSPDNIFASPIFWTVIGITLVAGVYLYGRSR